MWLIDILIAFTTWYMHNLIALLKSNSSANIFALVLMSVGRHVLIYMTLYAVGSELYCFKRIFMPTEVSSVIVTYKN